MPGFLVRFFVKKRFIMRFLARYERANDVLLRFADRVQYFVGASALREVDTPPGWPRWPGFSSVALDSFLFSLLL